MRLLKNNYTQKELIILKTISGQECFCCYSYTCRDNWSPAITFLKEGIFDSESIIYGIKSTQKGQFMLLGPNYTGFQYGI